MSATVQQISDNIVTITGVVRPAELDADNQDGTENQDIPTITTEE